jgi:Ca2+-binding RTX toxin-like protein
MSNTYEDFLDYLAERESGAYENQYEAVNGSYLGKYQMGEAALVAAGYVNEDGDTEDNDYSGGWTGKSNVYSSQDFLDDPLAQEEAVRKYHQDMYDQILYFHLDSYFGQTIGGILITPTGVLAAAHLKGIGNTAHPGIKQFLESGGTIDGADDNGTHVSDYLENLAGPSSPYDAYPIPLHKPPVPEDFRPAPLPNECPLTPWAEGVLGGFGDGENTGSPLVLDLDGDGIELATVNGSGSVYWDIDQDGFAEASGWIAGGDGLLAIDLNEDGYINDHSELFGDQNGSPNGFSALAAYDTNSDGYITSADTQFGDLLVWVDANADGYSQEGELYTLSELNITSIDLGYSNVSYTISGNEIKQESTFTINGNTRDIVDAWFAYDNLNTVYAQDVTLDVRTLFLPALRGYGNLPDLHIATSLDEDLLDMVQEIASADAETLLSSGFDLETKLTELLYQWAGVEGVSPTSRGSYIDARKVEFLEKFTDDSWTNGDNSHNPGIDQAAVLEKTFNEALAHFSSQLLAQTDINFIFGESPSYDPYTGVLDATEFDHIWFSDNYSTINSATDVNNLYVWSVGNGNDSIYESSGDFDALLFGSAISPEDVRFWNANYGKLSVYIGSAHIDIYEQFSANDKSIEIAIFSDGTIIDLVHNLTFTGTSSGEYIYGLSDNNTLVGKAGADYLFGYAGSDTYVWNTGDGNDRINDSAGIADVLKLGAGITANDARFLIDGYGDLAVFIGSEKIVIENQVSDLRFGTNSYDEVETLQFSDSGTIDLVHNLTFTGTSSGEYIYGLSDNNTLVGKAGSDYLYGYAGNDTYVWNSGNGNDRINDSAGTADVLKFGAGITANDVRFMIDGYGDLAVFVGSEKIVIENQVSDLRFGTNSYDEVETLQFSDSSTIDLVHNLTFTGTSSAEYLYGLSDSNVLKGLGGSDTLYSYDGNDTLYGGTGADTMNGGNGADTFGWLYSDLDGSLDSIGDFSKSGGDKIDISNVLDGAGYDPLTDALSHFVQFNEGASSTALYIDVTGSGTFNSSDDVVTLSGVTDILAGGNGSISNATDLASLISNGTLVV